MLPWIPKAAYSFSLFLEVKVQLSHQQETWNSVLILILFIVFDIV